MKKAKRRKLLDEIERVMKKYKQDTYVVICGDRATHPQLEVTECMRGGEFTLMVLLAEAMNRKPELEELFVHALAGKAYVYGARPRDVDLKSD